MFCIMKHEIIVYLSCALGEETSEYQAEPKSDERLIIYNKQITSSYALSSIGEKYDKVL